jgi:hypothetical protein
MEAYKRESRNSVMRTARNQERENSFERKREKDRARGRERKGARENASETRERFFFRVMKGRKGKKTKKKPRDALINTDDT